MKPYRFTIKDNEAGQRCDRFLLKYFKKSSRGNIYRMLRKKIITVNGHKTPPDYRLKVGDTVLFNMDETILVELTETRKPPLSAPHPSIIHEDRHVLIVEKPAGIIIHPDSRHKANTLVDSVLSYLREKGEFDPLKETTFSPAPVNRLDLNTSGLVLFAKNYQALKILNKLMKEKKIKKGYLALVRNHLENGGTLYGYLKKNEDKNQVKIKKNLEKGAKQIITEYRVLEVLKGCSLVKVHLITGRPHQIRAHFRAAGHPVAGDPKYGDRIWNKYLKESYGLKRQFLHAFSLKFETGEGELSYLAGKEFQSPLPEDLQKVLEGESRKK